MTKTNAPRTKLTAGDLAETVDMFAWMKALHRIGDTEQDERGKRIDRRPTKLHAAAHSVAFCIAAHWNTEHRMSWPTIQTIAFEAEVGAATVKRSIKALEDAGWLLVDHRPKPSSNLYFLTVPKSVTAHHEPLNGSPRAIEGLTMSPELRSELLNEQLKDEKTSVGAGAPTAKSVDKSINGEMTAEPMPLHPEWAPNNANRSVAAELGLNVEFLAEAFRQGMTESGERRTEWGKAFTAYLKAEADGVAPVTFEAVETEGMASDAGVQAMRDALSVPETYENPWGDYTPPVDAISAPVEAQGVIEAEVEDNAQRWTWNTDPAAIPAPVDPEADRAKVAALVEAIEAPREAEIEAQRRGHVARKVATKLGAIRGRERVEVANRIGAGEGADAIVEAIRAARSEAKHQAAAELLRARRTPALV